MNEKNKQWGGITGLIIVAFLITYILTANTLALTIAIIAFALFVMDEWINKTNKPKGI